MPQLKPLRQRMTPRQLQRREIRRKLRTLSDGDGTFGLLTVDRYHAEAFHGRHWRIWLDGDDVTARCFVADDRQRYAGLFVLDEEGRKLCTPDGDAIIEMVVGDVAIRRGEPLRQRRPYEIGPTR